jgi:hypothetical protein
MYKLSVNSKSVLRTSGKESDKSKKINSNLVIYVSKISRILGFVIVWYILYTDHHFLF